MTRPGALARFRFDPGILRWAMLLALAVVLVVGGGAAWDRWRTPAPATVDPAALRAGFGWRTFSEAAEGAEANVAAARQAFARSDQWVNGEALALTLLGRWRLNGDYADLAEADRLLDAGLASAPDPAGPVLAKAQLAVLVHRLDQVEAAVARVGRWAVPYSTERSDAATLAGDIAFQRGELDQAAAAYAAARAIADDPGIELREAMLAAARGQRAQAKSSLERLLAAPRQPPATLAQLVLLRANLAYAEGEWDEAARWVAAANRLFPGWWLAEAYAAQQQALAGRTKEAIRAYRAIAARTGRPEVMDALAHLLRLSGLGEPSRAWAARAAAGWRTRAALFPEAVAHHQAEHELALGDPARALAFARTDAAARPQAQNLALLARALLLTGRPAEALAALDRAARQGVTAGLLMQRAEALTALGRADAAAAAREQAETINPRAADPRTRLIWFGHD